jgi:hypothetical protein
MTKHKNNKKKLKNLKQLKILKKKKKGKIQEIVDWGYFWHLGSRKGDIVTPIVKGTEISYKVVCSN